MWLVFWLEQVSVTGIQKRCSCKCGLTSWPFYVTFLLRKIVEYSVSSRSPSSCKTVHRIIYVDDYLLSLCDDDFAKRFRTEFMFYSLKVHPVLFAFSLRTPGFHFPWLIPEKCPLHFLCKSGWKWNVKLSLIERSQRENWISNLRSLKTLQLTRCLKPKGIGDLKLTELHAFCHTSEARAAVFIPQLELAAATLAARLADPIRSATITYPKGNFLD
ncbi:unnamed protein product [Dibothriocephalus latus]|uniref:Uncharacterized protein n=1 Tax=Dibothriocephalus latus TaxID=60516 RepID=A0A3P7NW02_DIBLA|nr:unnamed protein product [Dibothriocephalus latus]